MRRRLLRAVSSPVTAVMVDVEVERESAAETAAVAERLTSGDEDEETIVFKVISKSVVVAWWTSPVDESTNGLPPLDFLLSVRS